jgi:ketosteroid isomerase-like protein
MAKRKDFDLVTKQLIDMEKNALERWNAGDPSGFLEISSKDVVYFDPGLERRLDGHGELTKLYENIRGQIHVDKYEMLNCKVQAGKDMAVLSYNLVSHVGKNKHQWNCTEVYRLENDNKWRIIQTHWSFAKPHIT